MVWYRRKVGRPVGGAPGQAMWWRDTTGPFECGGARGKLTCLPATTTGIAPGSVEPFLLYARHGIFELYVGSPLLLVQTMTYGNYPVAAARLGVSTRGGDGDSIVVTGVKGWQLSLAGRP